MVDEITNFPEGVSSFGIPLVGSGYIPVTGGRYLFVNPYTGNDGNTGLSANAAMQTIGAAVAIAQSLDVILIVAGSYDEAVVIPRTIDGLTLVGLGNLGVVGIAPSTAGAIGLTYHADDVTLINVGVAGESTATHALFGSGSRFRAYNCKIEGVDTSGSAWGFGPGTVAQVAAQTRGNSGDIKCVNCEFAWSKNGIEFIASDYGVPTQVEIINPLFHNIDGTEMLGTPGAFGIGSVRNLECLFGCFDNMEDGTKPSDFININTAFDTGIFRGNAFALATNASADLKIGAGIKWVANYTEAGSSTARPA